MQPENSLRFSGLPEASELLVKTPGLSAGRETGVLIGDRGRDLFRGEAACPREVRQLKARPLKIGPLKFGFFEMGPFQVGSHEARPLEVGL